MTRLFIWQATLVLLSFFGVESFSFTLPDETHRIEWFIEEKSLRFHVQQISEKLSSDAFGSKKDVDDAAQYFAIGLHPDKITMNNLDIMVMWHFENGSLFVGDFWNDASTFPRADKTFGGTDDVVFDDAGISSTGPWWKFHRLLDTGDAIADVVVEDKTMVLAWSYGFMHTKDDDTRPHKHLPSTKGGVSLNFFSGKILSNNAASRRRAITAHIACMFLAWLLIMFPCMALARFFKAAVPTWFKHHWRFNVVAALLAFGGALCGLLATSRDLTSSIHILFGLILVFILLPGQIILGYYSNKWWSPGHVPEWFVDKLHWWTGRVLLLGGLVNIIVGWYEIHAPSMYTWEWLLLAAMIWTVLYGVYFELAIGQQHEHLLQEENKEEPDETDALIGNERSLESYRKNKVLKKVGVVALGVLVSFMILSTVFLVLTRAGKFKH